MKTEIFQNKYRIKTTRAAWHNYSNGVYFVTVCTKNREHFFGEIVDDADMGPQILRLTEIGQFLNDNLKNINIRYLYAEIPSFVIMPNHWHAIVVIDGNKTPYVRRESPMQCVETGRAPSLRNNAPINKIMQRIDSSKGWLSIAIGGIKSAVTKFAHDNKIDFAWQTRFHDHIIHNPIEMNRIAKYIKNNPITWNTDSFYSPPSILSKEML